MYTYIMYTNSGNPQEKKKSTVLVGATFSAQTETAIDGFVLLKFHYQTQKTGSKFSKCKHLVSCEKYNRFIYPEKDTINNLHAAAINFYNLNTSSHSQVNRFS